MKHPTTSALLMFLLHATGAAGWVNGVASNRALMPTIARRATSTDAAPTTATNTALVFLKPHAVTDAAVALVRAHLADAGVTVLSEAVVQSHEVAEAGMIDAHYGTLAELAMQTDPKTLEVGDDQKAAFRDMFGLAWEEAPLLTNGAAQDKLGVSGAELEPMWRAGPYLKLSPGTYVAKLEGEMVSEAMFTLNGFYPAMREQFLAPGSAVHCFLVEFPEASLSWDDFRARVVGATDPAAAVDGSLRARILAEWQALGLDAAPSVAKNGVHASAGPLEGLKERIIWTKAAIADDAFGKLLLARGVDEGVLQTWLKTNPVVSAGGESDKIFDLTECMDSSAALDFLVEAGGGGGSS